MILHAVDKDLAKIFLISVVFLSSVTCDDYCGYTIPLLNGSNESASLEYFPGFFQGDILDLAPSCVSALGVIFEAVSLQAAHVSSMA